MAEVNGSSSSCSGNPGDSRRLTDRENDRIARNREKAKALRASRVVRPYPLKTDAKVSAENQDTGGGFLLDDGEQNGSKAATLRVAEDPLLLLGDEQPACKECQCQFAESFLLTHFRYHVCDTCRDTDGMHALIARTAAKDEFLLKDVDLDERPSALPFLLRRNPHTHFGEMKLYLKSQVEERALSIWGSTEAMDEERASREESRVQRKQKKLDKDMKVLAKSVLSKTKDRAPHQHRFPAESEVYNDDEDTWTKTCASCGYSVTFEKM